MINKKDYDAYIAQNKMFLDMLKRTSPVLYERIYDVTVVLDYITHLFDNTKRIGDELQVIFETGFSFLHEQIEEIKAYYELYFNKEGSLLNKYASFVNYNLYLNDLSETLREQRGALSEEIILTIDNISEEIDDLMLNNKPADFGILDKYNNYLEGLIPVGTLTTIEVFALIAEELGL